MGYISIIKEGMKVANKNWQLILIQFFFMFLGFLSMLIIVGIPLAIAFVIFGVDLTEMLRQPDLVGVFRIAGDMLSKSLPIVIFVVLSFILYAASLICMSIFVCSGTIGLLARSIQTGQGFSLQIFWSEARRLFFPVFIYANIAGLGFTLFTMIMGILSESANQLVILAETSEAVFSEFLRIFFGLLLGSTGLLIFLFIMGITLYGFGYLAFNRPRPFRGVKQIVVYMYRNPSSLLLISVMTVIFLAVLFVISMVSIFSASVPVIGTLLALPLNFMSQAALWYAIVIILASLFLFYYRTGYLPSLPSSRTDQDISPRPDDQQAAAPPAKEENQAG
jgi:hypothetical protein